MLTTTLWHGCCKFCISQSHKEYHDSTKNKSDSCSKNSAFLNPATGGYDPAPSNHGTKCNDKNIPGIKYFIEFCFLLFHIYYLLFLKYFSGYFFNQLCSSIHTQQIAVNQHIPVMSVSTVASGQCHMSFVITFIFFHNQ